MHFFAGALLISEQPMIIMTSVACAVGPSVTMSSTGFSFQSLVFGNLFEFAAIT
jgi:hypothetical protein